MSKVIITTVLDPETKTKLTNHSKITYIPYSKLIEYSLNNFMAEFKKVKIYSLKHSEFNRLKTISFTSSVPSEINDKLVEIAKKLEISKRLLLREIITEFVLSLQDDY
ncbi:MAG: hypothetical protein R3250_10690 [Melioribacteraceae bacterium]|nr:hypothetical protein [Melioribacteraceae bacterium]